MSTNAMLSIEHYSKSYGKGKKAADDVSLTVCSGDIYGFIGPPFASKAGLVFGFLGSVFTGPHFRPFYLRRCEVPYLPHGECCPRFQALRPLRK